MPGPLKFKGSKGKSKPYEKLGKDERSHKTELKASEGSPASAEHLDEDFVPRRQKTAAELRVEETQRKRAEEKARKLAEKSHKERVSEFNDSLEKISDHHDMPRIAGG